MSLVLIFAVKNIGIYRHKKVGGTKELFLKRKTSFLQQHKWVKNYDKKCDILYLIYSFKCILALQKKF